MVPPTIKQLDPRKVIPSLRGEGMTVRDYVEIFRKKGSVSIPSPDGKGVYTILMESGGYYVPKLMWRSFVRDEYDRYAPGRLQTNRGREILWYPKGLGMNYGPQGRGMYSTPEAYFVAMAKMVIGFILAGRKLYTLKCGANINSLNDNDTHNY